MATNATSESSREKNGQAEATSWHDHIRTFFNTMPGLALVYLLAIAIAEALTTLIEPRIGLILHGLLLMILLLHSALSVRSTKQAFLLTLALAPLVRLLSLSLPLIKFPFVYWYAIVGTPLFLAAFLAARVTGLSTAQIWMTLKNMHLQILIGITGIGLGYVEYLILHPAPLSEGPYLQQIWLPALILLIFTGLLEEIIFRGLMLYTSLRSLGRIGILYVSAIFAVLHIGYKSTLDVLFVFGVALFFSYATIKTGSLLGVSLSHGLTNIGLFLIFPFFVGTSASSEITFSKLEATATQTPQFYYTNTPLPSSTSSPMPTASPTATPTHTTTSIPTSTATRTAAPLLTGTPTASITFSPTPPAILPIDAAPIPVSTEIPLTPSLLYQIVVDDGDVNFLSSDGTRSFSQTAYEGDFTWATTSSSKATMQAEWRPSFSNCGLFDLEVFIPSRANLTRSALYQIGYRQGMATVKVDQSAHPGEWVSLGKYEFQPTSGTFLRLTNSTSESSSLDLVIVFDAARLTFIQPCR